jgi:hypothetical protein
MLSDKYITIFIKDLQMNEISCFNTNTLLNLSFSVFYYFVVSIISIIKSLSFLYSAGHIIVDLSCHKSYSELIGRFYLKNLASKQFEENLRQVHEPEAMRFVFPVDLHERVCALLICMT